MWTAFALEVNYQLRPFWRGGELCRSRLTTVVVVNAFIVLLKP